MFRVLVSRTFQREFHAIPDPQQAKTREALAQLVEDPYTPRSKADIHSLKDTNPQKYRLRVGDYRIIYTIEGNEVRIIEIFSRGHGYLRI